MRRVEDRVRYDAASTLDGLGHFLPRTRRGTIIAPRKWDRRSYQYRGCPPARVLAVDPAWLFDDHIQGNGRGATKHYECIPFPDLLSFPLPPLADDCLLALWRVAAMPIEPLALCKAWGFTPKAEVVWVKLSKGSEAPELGELPVNLRDVLIEGSEIVLEDGSQGAKLHFGMGHYTRASHEVCILATRGKVRVDDRGVRSVFFAPVGEHSEKPDRFYELMKRLVHRGPHVELFARRRRPGWRCYGKELP